MQIAWIVGLPFLAAPVGYLIGSKNEKLRDALAVLVSAAVLLIALTLPGTLPSFRVEGVFAYGLGFTTDGFRAVYACVTAVMWLGTSLFSLEYFREERKGLNRYWFFVLLTLGATEGVMLSADLMTTFVFFEILSFTSFTWVIHEETPEAVRAGYTYLFIAVIGGLVLFMGLLLLRHTAGTLAFAELREAAAAASSKGELLAAGLCILFGFGCKAGMFPVHIWLPKAHPVAPSPASALLSGILTKVGIYGILMTTMEALAGNRIYGLTVLLLGTVTMVLGAVLGVFSVNLKRTLACSSMSQVGFILVGTGMYALLTAANEAEGAETALAGTMLHMVNHSLIKLVLFMAAGVVVMRLHTLTLDGIRGWGRNKTALKIAFALGALGISGVPLFNGYISKTLLHEGIVEGAHALADISGLLHAVEWIFLISGGMTFCYMLKLFLCIFVEENADAALQKTYDADRSAMNGVSTAAICGSSVFMILLGQPYVMTRLAAFMTGNEEILRFRAFTLENLKGGAISLLIGGALYLFFVRKVLIWNGSYVNLWPEGLDLEDRVYRPLLTEVLPGFFGTVLSVLGENRVLRPLAKAAVFLGTFAGRLLSDSLDGVIWLLRKTVVSEKKRKDYRDEDAGFWWIIREGTTKETDLLTQNFSFALLMTCVGLLLVFGALVLMSVLHIDLFH